MKKCFFALSTVFIPFINLAFLFFTFTQNSKGGMMRTEEIKNLLAYVLDEREIAFEYLGYSGVILRTTQGAIIIDPADKLRSEEVNALPAGAISLVLFTHGHFDHFHRATAVNLFKATGSPILAEPSVAADLKADIPRDKLFMASVDEPFKTSNIIVRAVKGAHVGPILLYHLSIGEIAVFHGGDSGYVPLKGLKADVAFLPAGEPSPTASPEAALRMAAELEPKVVVIIHGSARQSKELESRLHEKWPKTRVIIPAPYAINRIKLD